MLLDVTRLFQEQFFSTMQSSFRCWFCRGMIEVISKLQEAVSKAAAEAEKEEAAVDSVLADDGEAVAEAELEAAVRDDQAGAQLHCLMREADEAKACFSLSGVWLEAHCI